MSYITVSADVKGKDSTCLSNVRRCARGLADLELYKNGPIPINIVQQAVDEYDAAHEEGKSGNRSQIQRRKNARKVVTEMFKKIVSFLQSVATEEDIPALMQAGFNAHVPVYRKKTAPAPMAG
ncbi:hypothetical protein KOM00_09445 [Geomonas sp. Red69]|uniref:Uncharacterized protein n=1 Tax=Geomonas diazotrophica TaxID=2843197 RepID=A0ABX8JKD9_9BACT|nr:MULTISPECIES: hypothetical protein [Geomonas]MBU5636958.1 hypothetical protein [Geomonas diazotrophica]QWV98858.1 hypothetical protein KP005_06135 [Geomonas nitrogeniifigens]QXE88005.1 hypothetical protein KP003_06285 [Geomonas nitrogeniifigens]